jgi:fructose-1,6-bisphosphatase/inositol monophosphatase family enzyme
MTADDVFALIDDAQHRFILPRFNPLSTAGYDPEAVTLADTEAESYITEHLRSNGFTVIGEEEEKAAPERYAAIDPMDGVVFTVDPVDGTGRFAQGHDFWGTLMTRAENGILTDAWAVCPTLYGGVRIHAKREAGVRVNGVIKRFDGPHDIAQTKVHVYGRRQEPNMERPLLYDLFDHHGPWFAFANSTSCAGELAQAFMEPHIGHVQASIGVASEWDYTPWALAMRESGGAAWYQHGDPGYLYKKSPNAQLIGTSPQIVEWMAKRLAALDF